MLKVSVVICTHNPRPEYLARVLAGLKAQTLPRAEWELLLVDNASKKPLAENFDLSWHPQARHVREEELGLTPARLRGIRESQAEILVFVDDDTVLASDYLEQALAVGAHWPFVGAWGGSAHGEFEVPLPAWVGNQVWRLTVVEVKEDVWSNLREGFATAPCGAGLCVRRNVCLNFLERCQTRKQGLELGRKGNSLAAYEDMEMVHCSYDLGLGSGKSTKLHLTHLIPASRLTVDYLIRQAEGDGASLMVFRANRGLPITPPKPLTWLEQLRWRLHRWRTRMPRELYEVHKAYRRGLLKGYAQISTTSFVNSRLKNNLPS